MEEMSNLSQEEKKQQINKMKQQCICSNCPTYNDCAGKNNELAYCAVGKSPECITAENGCVCPSCPITSMLGLTHMYFCTKGTEQEQRGG
jgi:hypothetical protein